ncbi:MAG: hypothetical protein HYY09_08935, partial [Firmicutes bacterium]|nr:hypothetical protein [Bacillota bacterium]
MILHTPVPLELIFHEPFGAAQRPPRLVETEFFGVQVQVELISPEEGRLA